MERRGGEKSRVIKPVIEQGNTAINPIEPTKEPSPQEKGQEGAGDLELSQDIETAFRDAGYY